MGADDRRSCGPAGRTPPRPADTLSRWPRCARWPTGPSTGHGPRADGCDTSRAWCWPTPGRRARSSTSRLSVGPLDVPRPGLICGVLPRRPRRSSWSRRTRRRTCGPAGLDLMGHPPFLVRPAGGAAPAPPPGVTLPRCATRPGLAVWDRVLAAGFPVPQSPAPPALLGGPTRFWLARRRGAGGHRAVPHRAQRRRRRSGGDPARSPGPRHRRRRHLGGDPRRTRRCPRCSSPATTASAYTAGWATW